MSALPRPFIAEPERHPRQSLAGRLREEWRVARWPARTSVICLLIFYLFAAASPVIAPYDPTHQYRNLPDCPPMALHWSHGSDRRNGWLFAYPMKMVDPLARHFVEDRTRKTYLRFFYHGRLVTTKRPPSRGSCWAAKAWAAISSRESFMARASVCVSDWSELRSASRWESGSVRFQVIWVARSIT